MVTCLWFGGLLASVAQPISLEAENGTLLGVVTSTAVPGYSGSGYVTGFSDEIDRVQWSFNATGGLYRLEIRYRSQFGDKEYGGSLNGTGLSGPFASSTTFAVANHGLVELVSGMNSLEIGGGWSWYEIDRVDLTPATPTLLLPVPSTLVDPEATLAARMLMADLVADYGKLTWTGQHQASEVPAIFSASGERPVIISGDLMEYSPSRIANGANPGSHTEDMIALEQEGYALSLCWHWNAPTNLIDTPDHEWWRGFYTHATTFDLAAALADTNSVEYALLLRDIDAIAVQLKKIADAGRPFLWRPLHEAAGGWFWWGRNQNPGPFKELWRLLFSRLTTHHRLHNLIWVLTNEDPDWYPGDDVVDIVGVDAYPVDHNDPLSPRWEGVKTQFDGVKLLALTEFGGLPDIERMHRYGVWWAYFLPWAGSLGPAGEPASRIMNVYQSAEVLTLDQANARPPAFLGIEYLAEGMTTLQGTGPRGAIWKLLSSTNLSFPNGNWSQIDSGTFTGGVLEYNDLGASNYQQRFYRMEQP